jgi:hypothetical protein
VRSANKDTALNKEASFPDDEFALDPNSDDLLDPDVGYDDAPDGCSNTMCLLHDPLPPTNIRIFPWYLGRLTGVMVVNLLIELELGEGRDIRRFPRTLLYWGDPP